MTTKDYLKQSLKFERMTRNKINEIVRCREMATSITVQDTGDRVQTSSNKDRLGTIMAKMIDLEQEIGDINFKRDRILHQIEKMDDPDSYQVLWSCYVDGEDVYNVKDIIHCSRTQVYKIYQRALVEFEDKYGKTYLKTSLEKE